jgi:hypothetical protein
VPIGVAIGVVFLGETLSATAWIGLACVVVGVAAMTIPSRAAAPARVGSAAGEPTPPPPSEIATTAAATASPSRP